MSADIDTFVVTQAKSAPERELLPNEQEYKGPDGTRSAMLIRVGPPVTEQSTMGKGGTWTHRTWYFAIDDGSHFDGQVLDSRISVNTSNSDKSKQYEVMTALAGRPIQVGTEISISKHLINRSCFIRIESGESGFPRITAFMAKPQTENTSSSAAAPAASGDDLPWK